MGRLIFFCGQVAFGLAVSTLVLAAVPATASDPAAGCSADNEAAAEEQQETVLLQVGRGLGLGEGGRPRSHRRGPELERRPREQPPRASMRQILWLTDEADMNSFRAGVGNCSYPGMMVPDYTKPMLANSMSEALALDTLGLHLDNMRGAFYAGLQVISQPPPPPTSGWLVAAAGVAMRVLEPFAGQVRALQGYYGTSTSSFPHQGPHYVGDWIANTYMAMFLEDAGQGEVVLDLTGNDAGKQPLQKLKRKVIQVFPSGLLKCKAFFSADDQGLKISRIEIDVPGLGSQVFSPQPSPSTRWHLANLVFAHAVVFMTNFWHTCFHAFAGFVTSAITRIVPFDSKLGGMLDASTLLSIHGMLQQMALLHGDHGSYFADGFFDCDIKAVRKVVAEVSKFFYSGSLSDVINCHSGGTVCQREWWAGGSRRFVEPVEAFGGHLAAVISDEERHYATDLESELRVVGLSGRHLCRQEQLAQFLTNLIFIQSVLHSHSVVTREFVSPYGGFPTVAPFVPLLMNSSTDQMGFTEAVDIAVPTIDGRLIRGAFLSFSVSTGLLGGPQLGDGPYYNVDGDARLQRALAQLRGAIAAAQQQCEAFSGPIEWGRFKPAWFYPRSSPVPYGYQLMQTAFM